MSYDLDAVLASKQLKPFPFTLGGETYELPAAESVTAQQAEDLDAGKFATTLRSIAGDEVGTKLANLPAFAVEKLLESWFAATGQSLGEGSASTGS